MKNTNIAVKPIKKDDVFKWWLVLTKPFHGLTDREMDTVAAYLREDYKLRDSISDEKLLKELLYSTSTRKRIMSVVNLDHQQFNNMLSTLRKKGIFKGRELNSKLFPNISKDAKDFKIIFQFKFDA